MEIVGFVAALGSIAKAGVASIKLANTLCKISKEAGDIGERLAGVSLQLETFGSSITLAQTSLELRCPRTLDSPVVQYIKKYDLLKKLKGCSRIIRTEMDARSKELNSIVSSIKFITALKWTMRAEPKFMNLVPKVQCLSTLLNMVLNSVVIEIAVERNKTRPSEEYKREIESLKRQLEQQINTIEKLVETNHNLQISIYPTRSSTRPFSSPSNPFRVICHLGQSLVEAEVVPTQPPETFSFTKDRREQQHQRRQSVPFYNHSSYQPGVQATSPVHHQHEIRRRSVATAPVGAPPSEPDFVRSRHNNPSDYGRFNRPVRSETHSHPEFSHVDVVRSVPENSTKQDTSESGTRRTRSPRQNIVIAKEVPTPREDHPTKDIPDTKRRISRVVGVVEPETPPTDERPTLTPLSHTESAQDTRGEINNARTRRAIRKQRQGSATIANSDIVARYSNLKPRPRPRSPPKSVEDTRGEIDHNPARSLKSSTTVDKLDGPSGSETLKLRSRSPPKGVIDPHDVGYSDTASSLSRTKEKQNTQSRPLGITVQTEPTPPPTPISPTQPSPIMTSSSSSSSTSSSSRTQRTPVVPQPRRQPPSPPGQATPTSQTRKTSTKNEIETAYVINPKTLKKTPFEVHIDRKYARNLITRSYTRKLELAVMYRYHLEELSYHGTKIAIVGRATLMWSTMPGNTLVEPRSVEVAVCEDSEDLEHQLIFGQWFVGAKKNLSREEAKEEEGFAVE